MEKNNNIFTHLRNCDQKVLSLPQKIQVSLQTFFTREKALQIDFPCQFFS